MHRDNASMAAHVGSNRLLPKVCCIFENHHIEIYYPNGSILSWNGQSVKFFTSKGIKNTFEVYQICKQKQGSDLYEKLEEAVQCHNKYSPRLDYYLIIDSDHELSRPSKEAEVIKLKHRINQFTWLNPSIQETKTQTRSGNQYSYMITSDDQFARLTLHADLYRVTVEYYQLLFSETQLQAMGVKNSAKNMTKYLLAKYNCQYTEIPTLAVPEIAGQSSYFYQLTQKHMTIFNLNRRWEYPLYLIWSSLLHNQEIKWKFCYLEYSWVTDLTDSTLRKYARSQMPEPVLLSEFDKILAKTSQQPFKQSQYDKQLIPTLGRINHSNKCLLFTCEYEKPKAEQYKYKQYVNTVAFFCPQIGTNVLDDRLGFWFITRERYKSHILNNQEVKMSGIGYRKYNKWGLDEEFYLGAVPQTLRIQNEPERCLKFEINLFASYCKDNDVKLNLQNYHEQTTRSNLNKYCIENIDSQIKSIISSTDVDQNTIIAQQITEFVHAKAYCHGHIYVKFVQLGLILRISIKQQQIKLIQNDGQILFLNVNNPEGVAFTRYQNEVNYSLEFMEKVYFRGIWQLRLESNEQINKLLESTDIFLKTTKFDLQAE